MLINCDIKGVKNNTKNSHTDLSCKLCQGPSIENQEYLLTCEGARFERSGQDLQKEQDFVIFWLSKLQDKRLSPGSTCDVPNIPVISTGDSADYDKST